jgi:hypothetical protein
MSESKELLEKMIHVETRPRRSPAAAIAKGFLTIQPARTVEMRCMSEPA